MARSPQAERHFTAPFVRELLTQQAPQFASLGLRRAFSGWDNDVWRLGDEYAVRLPRRKIAAPLVHHEHVALAYAAQRITALTLPRVLVHGVPTTDYPWHWSVLTWIDGRTGLDVRPEDRRSWATPLASAFLQLHQPITEALENPVRGVPLAQRAAVMTARLADVHNPVTRNILRSAWERGEAAAPHDGPPVLCHGDPHPGNLVATDDGRLTGLIDFGDATAGDPAVDFASAWLTFDEGGHDEFRSVVNPDEALWNRSRAWAAIMTTALLGASDDGPDYQDLAQHTLRMLSVR